MKPSPLISCIITTYKRPLSILKRAVRSVEKQTFKDIELIIINDYPKDLHLDEEIRKFIRTIKEIKVKYIINEKNMGAGASRNKGILCSEGVYLAFLDDDDEWLPVKLETQLTFMDDDNVGLVYCSYYRIVNDNKIKISLKDLSANANEEIFVFNFIGGNSFPLLRRSTVIEVGMYDENLPSSQDVDLWIRIIQSKHIIKFSDVPLVNYYVSDNAISTDVKKIKQGYDYILDKYKKYYSINHALYLRKLNMIGIALILHGDKKSGYQYWIRALKISPLNINNLLFLRKFLAYRVNHFRNHYKTENRGVS